LIKAICTGQDHSHPITHSAHCASYDKSPAVTTISDFYWSDSLCGCCRIYIVAVAIFRNKIEKHGCTSVLYIDNTLGKCYNIENEYSGNDVLPCEN